VGEVYGTRSGIDMTSPLTDVVRRLRRILGAPHGERNGVIGQIQGHWTRSAALEFPIRDRTRCVLSADHRRWVVLPCAGVVISAAASARKVSMSTAVARAVSCRAVWVW
jgi:hypothetical protein